MAFYALFLCPKGVTVTDYVCNLSCCRPTSSHAERVLKRCMLWDTPIENRVAQCALIMAEGKRISYFHCDHLWLIWKIQSQSHKLNHTLSFMEQCELHSSPFNSHPPTHTYPTHRSKHLQSQALPQVPGFENAHAGWVPGFENAHVG